MSSKVKIFDIDGTGLADNIAKRLGQDYDSPLGAIKIDHFSDKEMSPQFMETIRGKQVFLVGSTNTPENIVKMLLSVDAAMRASAKEIITVIPYFGYARQDRKEGARGPIGAALMAKLLQSAGIHRIMAVDFHAAQIQGFFNLPVDHLGGHTIFLPYLLQTYFKRGSKYTFCSPDAGGVKRAMTYFKKVGTDYPDLDISFALLDKRRAKPNEIEKMTLIGDVKGRHVILIDDMVDTAGTLCTGASKLVENGAESVIAVAAHGVLTGKAYDNINQCKELSSVIISDSIRHDDLPSKVQVLTLANILADAIKVVSKKRSLEQLNA